MHCKWAHKVLELGHSISLKNFICVQRRLGLACTSTSSQALCEYPKILIASRRTKKTDLIARIRGLIRVFVGHRCILEGNALPRFGYLLCPLAVQLFRIHLPSSYNHEINVGPYFWTVMPYQYHTCQILTHRPLACLMILFLHLCIYPVLLNPDIPCLFKQCRSRSVGFFRRHCLQR